MIANDNAKPQTPPKDAAGVEAWSGKDKGDENFPVGSLLIAKELRPHIHAYYNFARNADDISDSSTLTAEEKIARLDAMEAVLTGAQTEGSPSATILRASLAATGVDPIHARELLIAFRQDATKTRYASWDELLDYCRFSAMPVGRHVLDLHGESRDPWPASDALCAALQVVNHLQDCARDLATLDRCYLPLDRLAAHGATIDDVRAPATSKALRAVFDAVLDAVDGLNALAPGLPRQTRSRRLRLETGVIVALCRRLAARLRRQDPLASRVKLTRLDIAASLIEGTTWLLAGPR